MEIAWTGQLVEDLPRGPAGVDDAQNLLLLLQAGGQVHPGQRSCLLEGNPAEGLPVRFGHGANLPDGDFRSEFLKNGVQSGLSGGTQNSGSAVVPDQLGNRPDTGSQIGEGEHLGLVKDQDALGQVVELPAFGRPAGIKGFKELDCCGDDYRNIPRLHRPGQRSGLRTGCIVLLLVELHAGVEFQNVFITQNLPKGLGSLLDNRCVGDHINDSLHPAGFGLRQRKGQGGHGFSAAGGHCQREEARSILCPRRHALFQNHTSLHVQSAFWGKPAGDIGFQAAPQFLHRGGRCWQIRAVVHKRARICVVCIYQAGKEHPREKHPLQPCSRKCGGICMRQGEFTLPGMIVLQHSSDSPD